MKILVVFRNLPPDLGGSSTIISNLFQFADNRTVITGRASRTKMSQEEVSYEKVEIPLSDGQHSTLKKIKYFIRSLIICLKLIKTKQTNKILGIYRDESSLVLSFFLSVLSNKSLYIYLTDLYAENYKSSLKNLIQKIIFYKAEKIFCLNEAMRLHYISKGYQKVYVIPSTIPTIAQSSLKKFESGIFNIAFSGTVTFDRLDLLQELVNIFGNKPGFHIYLFTPQDKDFLVSNNLLASNVTYCFIESREILLERLKNCHLLYLPLTFKKPHDSRGLLQLETCLGTKSYEYMQTGVPILVHSPRDYYTYKYFEENDSALLLGSDNQKDLEFLIYQIKENYSELSKVALNAYGKLTHNLSKPTLMRLLNLMK